MDNLFSLLDTFNLENYTDSMMLEKKFKVANHKEAIQLIKTYQFTQPYDYIRSCGNSSFTDFSIKKLNALTTEDSKYLIARNFNGQILYLYCNNFLSKVDEFNFIINKGYFDSFKSDSQKIKAHFISENELIVGNKSSNTIKITLEKADISSLISRKFYYFKKNHLTLQTQVGALGLYLKYFSKIAKNDKNRQLNSTPLNKTFQLDMTSLLIQELTTIESINKIDLIDVIWIKNTPFSQAIAFEVELSKNFDIALDRLVTFNLVNNYSDTINIILTDRNEDYLLIKSKANSERFSLLPKHAKIAHLTVQNLIRILEFRNNCPNPKKLERLFFQQLTYV